MSECREGQQHFEFSMSPDVTDQLQRISDAHADAMDLFEQGDYAEAEVALGEALTQEVRDVARARILLDTALCIWKPYEYARDGAFAWAQESFERALTYLNRAEIIFNSDEHRIVSPDEIQLLKELRKTIEAKIVAPSHENPVASFEEHVNGELIKSSEATVVKELGHTGTIRAHAGYAMPEFSVAA